MKTLKLTTNIARPWACHHSQNWVQTKIGVYCTAVRVQIFTDFFGLNEMLNACSQYQTMLCLLVKPATILH